MTNAVVVGAGPNGLAGAITLARQGVHVTVLEAAATPGGGARSSELTVPGLVHDHCSAVHPLGIGSPFMQTIEGLDWAWPDIDLAHPLDDGSAGLMHRSLTETAQGLGVDGPSWARLFGPLSEDFDLLAGELLQPLLHAPRHPVAMARYGARALLPATRLARRWRTPQARALYGGVAAHLFHPLTSPTSAGLGLMMVASGHRYGWPVARGGSQSITDTLVATLEALGGKVVTGVQVRTLAQLGSPDVVLLDTSPRGAAEILGDALPRRVGRAYRRFRHGPAAFKVDFAIDGHIPWRNEACRRAGTVHLGGDLKEIVHTEAEIHRGRMPEQPFVLVGQQYLADPTRSAGALNPIWAYAHVPHGYPGDATEAVVKQIERFAPGFREQIVATSQRTTEGFSAYNANYVGGDIITGANSPRQLVFRPRVALAPYRTGVPGVFLCSAATPPGAGVHGMCGFNAARSALGHLEGRTRKTAVVRSTQGSHHR
ncbi:phytoene desaturase family protein [Marmoricola sp. RAF53]|uniref:phytoene desaturase family protein n=1 Tax=Marmoricola sp. RAF53 TaxID=3233059 RepID=UPI003F9478CA